jgi:hypothetical protein
MTEPLPPGKYERRNGHPAWVIGTTPDGKGLVVCHTTSGCSFIYCPDGKWSQCGDHPHDLIAPWKEPRKVSGTVYLVLLEYDSGNVQVICDAQDISGWCGKVIARRVIEVELTEGEGL